MSLFNFERMHSSSSRRNSKCIYNRVETQEDTEKTQLKISFIFFFCRFLRIKQKQSFKKEIKEEIESNNSVFF